LKEGSFNVSEVSYKVGFGSTSYFIKCFREQYGYPPGEVAEKKAEQEQLMPNDANQSSEYSQSHQLAAIMFTDIEGYTALMQKDEDLAVGYRNRHREIFKSITNKFKGKILQYYGDGTLSTFKSAVDAVRCGIELQKSFREEPSIPVRIGIHTGDIIFTEDDIIGDGVNVASRIEALAQAGSVLISDKVYDEVKNKAGIQTSSMGVHRLKNVDKAVEIYALIDPGLLSPKLDNVKHKSGRKRFISRGVYLILAAAILVYLIFMSGLMDYIKELKSPDDELTKQSIAVLPFINDSDDSTNIYIVNGLMESILNNLQKIEDLRVISRTSVEKYRDLQKTIPEIAEDLDVRYFVEGSGQKIGEKLMLHIQLIDARGDKHLWARRYEKDARDIFALQQEVAKDIAGEIEVIITPEEEARIDKIYTDDLLAYDYFLQGYEFLMQQSFEDLYKAIGMFEKAVKQDPSYARAYAAIAISYYYIDFFSRQKLYADSINKYADQALLFDPQLAQSLMAKALFYMHSAAYELAIPYLEKALEYNPNSALVINTLSDMYANYFPDTEKYLEYALKGVGLNIAAHDSATASIIYLHLSNAFIQSGFISEAEKYIDRSLEYEPGNIYSAYVKAYIQYAVDKDLNKLKDRLVETLKMDTTRLDVLQEVGKAYYYMRDYENAYFYYKKFVDIRDAYKLDMYWSENGKIALVYSKMGYKEESKKLLKEYKDYADRIKSVYKQQSLSMYYSMIGDADRAMKHLKLFALEENYFYWTILFMEIDPIGDNIKDKAEFKKVTREIESKFWNYHKNIRNSLEEKGLI